MNDLSPIDAPLPIDPSKTHQIAEFKHELALTHGRIDPTGRFGFAGAEDLNVYRWELEGDPKAKSTLSGHESWVRSMDFSADGETLYTGAWDGRVGVWDVAAGKPKASRFIEAHDGVLRWVRVSPDGSKLATCGNDLLVKVWNADDGRLLQQFSGHERHPYSVAFHPDGRLLASFDLMGVLKIWDLDTGKEAREIDASIMTGYDDKFAADMGGARDMCFDASGTTLACAGITNVKNSFAGIQDPIVVLVDWATGKQTQHKPPSNFQGIAWGVRFHPQGFIVGAGANRTGEGAIWFWKDGKEQPFHTVTLKKQACRSLDLSFDNQNLVVACADGGLRVFGMTAKY